MTLLSQLRDVPARLRNQARQVPTHDIDEDEVEVDSSAHAAAGATAVTAMPNGSSSLPTVSVMPSSANLLPQ